MRIFQLILNDNPSSDVRYAKELYKGITNNFKEHIVTSYTLSENKILLKNIIDQINTYDYLFIHNLDNHKEHYLCLSKFIKCKKILFITKYDSKKFLARINNEYITELINSCYKIVLDKKIDGLVEIINKLSKKKDISQKLVQLEYIYNVDLDVVNNSKTKDIIQISNKGLHSGYELFIKMFLNKKSYLDEFIWKIYGVNKNIQTLYIDKLYIDKETNSKSDITNFDNNIIYKDKINIYPTTSNENIKKILYKSYFACCFDDYNYINYTILDIIYSGTIPVFDINYSKNIKINDTQSIYDIITGIYIDDSIITDNVFIQMNKYIQSSNSYKSIIVRNINMCNKLYNPKINIANLFKNIINGK
jgi:hypothetical protein